MNRHVNFALRYGYAAASSFFLFTGGVASPRHRALIGQISQHFGYRPPAGTLPRVALEEVVPEEIEVQLRKPEATDGNVTLYELLAIVRFVRELRPARLFEIGTFDGRTTLNLAANSPADACIYTLDLPRERMNSTGLPVAPSDRVFIDKAQSGSRYLGTELEPKITQLYGDSATFDFAEYQQSVDFIFVDGSHAFEYVLKDSETALRLLSPAGGLVLWHDYGVAEGVNRALDDLYRNDPRFAALQHIDGTSLAMLRR